MNSREIGEKIRKWDEVNGAEIGQAEPDVSPQDQKNGPQLGTGSANYLKSAEEQLEDDYSSIDGIINNGSRREAEELKDGDRASVMEKIREHEEKLKENQAIPQYRSRDFLCPDRERC